MPHVLPCGFVYTNAFIPIACVWMQRARERSATRTVTLEMMAFRQHAADDAAADAHSDDRNASDVADACMYCFTHTHTNKTHTRTKERKRGRESSFLIAS